MRKAHGSGRSEVYIVMRVFELESRCPQMRLYLDPEQLRLDDELEFTAETWSVVPRIDGSRA